MSQYPAVLYVVISFPTLELWWLFFPHHNSKHRSVLPKLLKTSHPGLVLVRREITARCVPEPWPKVGPTTATLIGVSPLSASALAPQPSERLHFTYLESVSISRVCLIRLFTPSLSLHDLCPAAVATLSVHLQLGPVHNKPLFCLTCLIQ